MDTCYENGDKNILFYFIFSHVFTPFHENMDVIYIYIYI